MGSPATHLLTQREWLMHPVERALLAALTGPCAVKRGEKGLLAVSGGPDSLALLEAMVAVRSRLRLRVEVAHFDHGLRAESSSEARWVAARAAEAGIPVHVRRAEHLRGLTHGVQAVARAWRRAELAQIMSAIRADWIATAHQQDDQMETLLLKLLRGAHLSHLRGMEWRDGPFVRPLLGLRRQALQAYLRDHGRQWLEDPSNASGKYLRNRVRNELIPLLNVLAGGAIATRLGTLERQSRELAGLLSAFPRPKQSAFGETPAWMEIAALRRLPRMAQSQALERFVQEHAPGDLAAADVERALDLLDAPSPSKRHRWMLHWPQSRQLERKGSRLVLQVRAPQTSVVHRIDDVRVIAPSGWNVQGARGSGGPAGARAPGVALANIPANAEITVRRRMPGDRIHMPWRNGNVKVKDFLRDQGVPLWQRDQLPVVALNGTVVAIYPDHVAMGFVPDANSLAGAPPPLFLKITVGPVWGESRNREDMPV